VTQGSCDSRDDMLAIALSCFPLGAPCTKISKLFDNGAQLAKGSLGTMGPLILRRLGSLVSTWVTDFMLADSSCTASTYCRRAGKRL